MNYKEIIQFWFYDIKPSQIWTKDEAFDQLIIDRFSRNMFRDSHLAFKFDALVLSLAQHVVANGIDKQVDKDKRSFIYLPFMHSESRIIHKQALEIYKNHGAQGSLDYEIKHKNIIDKFGRYPHRN